MFLLFVILQDLTPQYFLDLTPQYFLYDQFIKWKERNNFKEYEYKKMYAPGGTNPREIICQKRY